MKKINLEEILIKACAERRWHLGTDFKSDILKAMLEACKKTVDLCAYNAELGIIYNEITSTTTSRTSIKECWIKGESILKTKDEIG